MPLSFFLKKLVSSLLKPPLMPLLIIIAGLLMMRRWPRAGKAVAWSGVAVSLLLVTPVTVNRIVAPLEAHPVISAEALRSVEAIVILAGGQRRNAEEYGGPVPNRFSLERIRYGARIARSSGLPVLVSGGAPTGSIAEAQLMAEVLAADFGVKVKWVEGRSLDTAENAAYSAAMLREAGIRRVALVSHAMHLRRAMAEFRAHGIDPVPAPTVFLGGGPNGDEFFDYLPSVTSAIAGWYGMHEWLGIAAQKLRGM